MDEYGPQTEEIKKFLERVRNLTPAQADELNTARNAVSDSSWDAASVVVSDAVSDDVWAAVWDAARNASWKAARNAPWIVARAAVLDVFWAAVWDAVLALVVKDKISEEHFNVLYGPWKSVMEK